MLGDAGNDSQNGAEQACGGGSDGTLLRLQNHVELAAAKLKLPDSAP